MVTRFDERFARFVIGTEIQRMTNVKYLSRDTFKLITEVLVKCPDNWRHGDTRDDRDGRPFTLVMDNDAGRLEFWVANGFWFYRVHRPNQVAFTFIQKIKFSRAYRKWCIATGFTVQKYKYDGFVEKALAPLRPKPKPVVKKSTGKRAVKLRREKYGILESIRRRFR